MYRIREVDGSDDDVADELRSIDYACFGDTSPKLDVMMPIEDVRWWFVYQIGGDDPVAYAGLKSSFTITCGGYLCRAGVLPGHRGRGLQRRLIRVREARARRDGWAALVTDTTDNPASANSLISAGFKLYAPERPWGLKNSLYWKKLIAPCQT